MGRVEDHRDTAKKPPRACEAFLEMARHRGFEPLTYGSGVSRPLLGGVSRGSQVGGTVHGWTSLAIQGSHPLAEFSRPLVTPLLQGPAGLRVVYRQRDRALFSVRQVAERLGVSTATVYGLVTRGEVPHVRVANAIRVALSDLATFVNTKTRVAAVGRALAPPAAERTHRRQQMRRRRDPRD